MYDRNQSSTPADHVFEHRYAYADRLPALLRFLFFEVPGLVRLTPGKTELVTEDIDEIQMFLQASELDVPVHLDLSTTEHVAAHSAVAANGEDEIGTILAVMGQPSLALEHQDGIRVVLFYSGCIPHLDVLPSIPLPGTGGWDLTEISVRTLVNKMETDTQLVGKVVGESSAEPANEGTSFMPEQVNAMTCVSLIPPDILNHEIVLSYGKSHQDQKWHASPSTWWQFLTLMSKHIEGQKGGQAFIQGTVVGGQRRKTAVDALYVVGMDVDCGITWEEGTEQIQALKLAYLQYSTHSHMKCTTEILQSSYLKWAKKQGFDEMTPNDDRMARFLIEVRSWTRKIAETVKVGATIQSTHGLSYAIEHAPMPKFRLVLPLARPFIIKDLAAQGNSQAEVYQIWARKLLGLARILNLPIDESCLDPSRLFYMPRHPKGMPFCIEAGGSVLLDLDTIPEINPRAREDADITSQRIEDAAKALGAGSGSLMFGEFNLKAWAAKGHARTWRAADGFRDRAAPGVIRTDKGLDKLEIRCPFDDEHGNAGDDQDVACWVISAHAEGGESGFSMGCRHNSCQGKDRLEFLCAALEQEMIHLETLTADAYHALTEDDPPRDTEAKEEVLTRLMVQVKALDKSHNEYRTQLRGIITTALASSFDSLQMDCLKEAICTGGHLTRKTLEQVLKELRQAQPNGEGASDSLKKRVLQAGYQLPNGCQVHLLKPGFGDVEQKEAVLAALTSYNAEREVFFDMEGKLVRCRRIGRDVRLEAVDPTMLTNAAEQKVRFFKADDSCLTSIAPKERFSREALTSEGWSRPSLVALSGAPFFDCGGRFIHKSGYDHSSHIYLKHAFDASAVPETPGAEEIIAARDLLIREVFGEFPFDDGPDAITKGAASRAHFLAMLLQPMVRPIISGPTPIYLVSKPKPGTGSSLLVESALMISHNLGLNESKSESEKASEDEFRKMVTGHFAGGNPYLFIDNVNQELTGAALCNLATGGVWEDRELSKNNKLSFPNRMQVIIAGNNPSGSYEVMRRCVPIRLDARRDPRGRQFRIENLREYVKEHRQKLMESCVTIVKAWIAEGCPKPKSPTLISFESWAQVMGGICQVAGVPGFLGNMHLTQSYADDETREWEAFLSAWANPDQPSDVGKLGVNLPISTQDLARFYIAMPDQPQLGFRITIDDARLVAPRLAKALAQKAGAPYSIVAGDVGMTVCVKRETSRNKTVTWTLVRMCD